MSRTIPVDYYFFTKNSAEDVEIIFDVSIARSENYEHVIKRCYVNAVEVVEPIKTHWIELIGREKILARAQAEALGAEDDFKPIKNIFNALKLTPGEIPDGAA